MQTGSWQMLGLVSCDLSEQDIILPYGGKAEPRVGRWDSPLVRYVVGGVEGNMPNKVAWSQ